MKPYPGTRVYFKGKPYRVVKVIGPGNFGSDSWHVIAVDNEGNEVALVAKLDQYFNTWYAYGSKKLSSFEVIKIPGRRNYKGKETPWCIKSREEILECFDNPNDAYEVLEMHRRILQSITKKAYIRYTPGHKNYKGEEAPWCIYSHETHELLQCYKTKAEAEKALKRMKYYKKKSSVAKPYGGPGGVYLLAKDGKTLAPKKGDKVGRFEIVAVLGKLSENTWKVILYDPIRNKEFVEEVEVV